MSQNVSIYQSSLLIFLSDRLGSLCRLWHLSNLWSFHISGGIQHLVRYYQHYVIRTKRAPEQIDPTDEGVYKIKTINHKMAERGDETGTEFLRPADKQKGCSLLSKVPFEIRQRIWRMLLKSEDNLQSVGQIICTQDYVQSRNSADKSIATFASWCNLTAQILLTCQQINKEGGDVLHRESEVILWLSPEGGIHILGSARNQGINSFA